MDFILQLGDNEAETDQIDMFPQIKTKYPVKRKKYKALLLKSLVLF